MRLSFFSTSELGHKVFTALPFLCIAGLKERENWISLYQTENLSCLQKVLANVLLYLFIILLYLLEYEQTYHGFALIKIMYIARYLGVDFVWLWLRKIKMKLVKDIQYLSIVCYSPSNEMYFERFVVFSLLYYYLPDWKVK